MNDEKNKRRIDFEVLNSCLNLELNTALQKETVIKIVRSRLNELSREEKTSIPKKVLALAREIANNKPALTPEKTVTFSHSGDKLVIHSSTKPATNAHIRRIVESNFWRVWSPEVNATISEDPKGIVITSKNLRGLQKSTVKTLLGELGFTPQTRRQ